MSEKDRYSVPFHSRARDALRLSAERLFAEHGVDGVSLRQITRDAGQRNTTALQYHFGSRDGLLREVLDHHLAHVAVRRDALLDRYEIQPGDLLELVDGLVMPLCAELNCADGGRDFLRIAAEVVNRSDWMFEPGSLIEQLIGTHRRWGELAGPFLSAGAAGRLHRRFAAMRFVYAELGRRSRQPLPRRDDRLFASQLTDLVAALLTAPLSPRTKALLPR
ncbi:MAG TPA: helix-turn-helix domain-containing protein [Pseudonocardia sp.]|uniref:TetR/AcrR family transcriptional regulator n=1 Tax=Pseudonocardia sp. TaxID=60912 RepID=UPI002F41C273